LYPNACHSLLSEQDIRQFLSANFSTDVIEAFETLSPYAFKADLARYAFLLVQGGLYVDLANRFLRRLDIPDDKKIVCFRDRGIPAGAFWAVSNSIIYASPGRDELKLAIDLILANCRNKEYGYNPLCPTGPLLLGRAFAITNQPEECFAGEVRCLTPEFPNQNACFIQPDGRFVAIRMKDTDGEIRHLGFQGTNDYNELWRKRQVFGEVDLVFPFTDDALFFSQGVSRTPDGAQIESEAKGIHIFGPYITLPPGHYVGTISVAPATVVGDPQVDVCANYGSVVYADTKYRAENISPGGELEIHFTLPQRCSKIEVRVSSDGPLSMKFLGLRILRVGA